jgi:sorting nexin-8
VSIEQVAHRAQSNSLPQPTLDLDTFRASATALLPEALNSLPITQSQPDVDPWRVDVAATFEPSREATREPCSGLTAASLNAVTSGLGKNWWKHRRNIEVTIIPEKQGFILARYTAYLVTSEVSAQKARNLKGRSQTRHPLA